MLIDLYYLWCYRANVELKLIRKAKKEPSPSFGSYLSICQVFAMNDFSHISSLGPENWFVYIFV